MSYGGKQEDWSENKTDFWSDALKMTVLSFGLESHEGGVACGDVTIDF